MSDAHGIARDQLRSFIERVERLEAEKKTIADDIKDVYGEAKSMGYDTKIMKKVVALRKIDDQKRTEEDLVLDTYLSALGMIPQFEMFDGNEVKPSREDRRRQRTTEAMDDHKSLVDEMADAGLISEEARHENKALADAVATKFGNGPAQALQSPRKAAEAVAEMPREDRNDDMPVVASGDVHRDTGSAMARTEASAVTDRRDDHLNSPIAPASQGEAEAPSVESVSPEIHGSSDANTGECPDDFVANQKFTQLKQAVPGLVSTPRTATPGTVTRERDPSVPMHKAAFAHCFPELSKSEYLKLRDSIIAIGISEPVIRKGDVILDGWCRYDIARSIGIHYPVFEYDGSDELLDVIRLQRSSRDWTPQQEAKIAKALAAEVPARAEEIFAAFHIVELPDGEVVAA